MNWPSIWNHAINPRLVPRMHYVSFYSKFDFPNGVVGVKKSLTARLESPWATASSGSGMKRDAIDAFIDFSSCKIQIIEVMGSTLTKDKECA